MKIARLVVYVLASIALLSLSGCSTSPLFAAVNVTKWDGGVSNPTVTSPKKGEACAMSILGLVAVGDASIEGAKKDGGITKVATVDHSTLNILYLYGQYCTVVHGE